MRKNRLVASLALAIIAFAAPAFAGPPFLCHPFDIGTATSLPWKGHDWLGLNPDYDVHAVVADTEALLTPAMPTLVRMETLRRAVLYASRDRAIAERLLAAVMTRLQVANRSGAADATAWFDAGYVVEALREIEQLGHHMSDLADRGRLMGGITGTVDGRPLLETSAAMRPGDTATAFALALISRAPDANVHLTRARAGAKHDRLLASNLARLQLQ